MDFEFLTHQEHKIQTTKRATERCSTEMTIWQTIFWSVAFLKCRQNSQKIQVKEFTFGSFLAVAMKTYSKMNSYTSVFNYYITRAVNLEDTARWLILYFLFLVREVTVTPFILFCELQCRWFPLEFVCIMVG